MKSAWDGADLNEKVSDDLLVELFDDFAATMWTNHMSEAVIDLHGKVFKSRGLAVGDMTAKHLSCIQTNLGFWFLDLEEDEAEKFVNAFELLDICLEKCIAAKRTA